MAKKMEFEVTDNTHEVEIAIDMLVKQVKKFADESIYVGVPDDTPTNPETGVHPVYYGTIHEFGLEGFPERSFIRSTINDNRKAYGNYMKDSIINVLENGGDIEIEKGKMGELVAGDIKKYILANKVTPASSSKITMVDTEHLVSSITYRIGK